MTGLYFLWKFDCIYYINKTLQTYSASPFLASFIKDAALRIWTNTY
jgi:hypothetical protein